VEKGGEGQTPPEQKFCLRPCTAAGVPSCLQ